MRSKVLLYLIPREGPNTNARLAGIRRAAASLGYTVERVLRNETEPGDMQGLIAFWQADACLVECAGIETAPSPTLFGRTPVVFIDCDPDGLPKAASCLSCAGDETARIAARALLKTGAATYAYVRPRIDFYWSRSREKCFKDALRLNGHDLVCLQSSCTDAFDLASVHDLADAFTKMARPIGVFAANDFVGAAVFDAAKLARLAIPGDLSVVGVDDNAEICEHTQPTLSSIRLDFRASGEKAVEMAVRLVEGRRHRALRDTYDALGLVPRGSCPAVQAGGHAILVARNYISSHLSERISVSDVVQAMNCSRRTAELRFRAACGHSILEEIRMQRFERAQILTTLRPELSLDAIAREVGYSNRSALWKLRLSLRK